MKRILCMSLLECVVVSCSWFFAFYFRHALAPLPDDAWAHALLVWPFVCIVQWGSHYYFRNFNALMRFTALRDLVRLVMAYAMATFFLAASLFFIQSTGAVPRSILFLYFILLVVSGCGIRALVRYAFERRQAQEPVGERIILVGAGSAAESLIRDFRRRGRQAALVGVVDDNLRKVGAWIRGVKVLGVIASLPDWVSEYSVDRVIIAIPSLTDQKMREIYTICEPLSVMVVTLPGLQALTDGRVTIDELRPIQIEDLLGRSVNIAPLEAVQSKISQKNGLNYGGRGLDWW